MFLRLLLGITLGTALLHVNDVRQRNVIYFTWEDASELSDLLDVVMLKKFTEKAATFHNYCESDFIGIPHVILVR